MVIGKEFIWLHMGKTGGNSTKTMFDNVSGIIYADSIHEPAKHSVLTRTDIDPMLLHDKKIICNIRLLPLWIKSYRQQMIVTKKQELSLEELCNAAEGHIKRYSIDVDHWLRTEALAEDFIRVLSNYIYISPQQQQIIRKTHINNRTYLHNLSGKEISYIYDSCPTWKEIENEVYK